ncbi:dTDP-4-dehydrorhamnose reductase family protein [Shewanella mangrovisoli]|uniref:dTDP-4-dehydrorhamnose reductase family protein n=1 Tax=Shewanella mangrovisoli TaxID=2864211 RepID=UPI0035B757EB
MANIMVTGATGLLGRAVVKQLTAAGHRVIATGFSRAEAGIHRLDLTQAAEVEAFIAREQPEVIVHCAAERRPDVSEHSPEHSLALNLSASQTLAEVAKAHQAWLLYISTDYVFDGTTPPYAEDAAPHPVNFYGESKLQGETFVLNTDSGFAVLSLPILYGEVTQLSESAVLVLINQLLDSRPQRVDHWAIRSPTSTADIANAIAKLIQRQADRADVSGIYHFSATQTMTKYQMLLSLGELLGIDTAHLLPEQTPMDSAKRPQDCTLSCGRLAALGIYSELDFKAGLSQALSQSSVALAAVGCSLRNHYG